VPDRCRSASARLLISSAMASRSSHQPTYFREDLRARMPEPGETIELGLAAGTPVVEIVRTAYTDDGHPVEVSEMIADAGAYVFRCDFATS
jgi:GntR family transcriptional regulator